MSKSNGKKRIMTISIAVVLTVMVIALVAPSTVAFGAPSNQGAVDGNVPVHSPVVLTREMAQTVTSYWTPEKMASASPMPLPVITKQALAAQPYTANQGQPGFINGNLPGETANTAVVHPTFAPVSILTATSSWYVYPFPYQRASVSANSGLRAFPYITNGRLFFTQDSVDYSCSGTSVTSATGRLVMTAGHCVNDGLGNNTANYSTNVLFCPAYDKSAVNPTWGCWAGVDLWTTTEWATNSNYREDFGGIVTATTGTVIADKINNAIGSQGFAYNYGPQNGLSPQFWVEFGYPAQGIFTGGQLFMCMASLSVTDAPNALTGPDTNGVGCDFTGGSSGGAWIYNFKTGNAAGYLNGHTDYKITTPDQSLAIYSPYYGSDAYNLWNAAQVANP